MTRRPRYYASSARARTANETDMGCAVEYPSSDGKPMAESDLHFDRLVYAAQR